ncbi:copper amine oxidase N-terminal domain-containing protein [Paenibacillus alba]|uniref:Copper amine oxidase N-terminal domain-containing protein n=1 Tax=Paenibacillus alba TaxID=1197127 RepID=A0ABU6G175_9BACL|nr:copper amine oxidase N-terminal domain-containing protein [Paenibacillus alba]MEC0227730.1 copper amine oxidase N-terminal domain-containing protein [Paenibacillus alba]
MFWVCLRKTILISSISLFAWNYGTFTTFASIANDKIVIKLKLDETKASINGKPVLLGMSPHLVNNTTMVPLRFVTEALGAEVLWDGNTQSVQLKVASQHIFMKIGSVSAKVNDTSISLEQPPIIENDITLVPIRFIAENFHQSVSFDDQTHEINIMNVPVVSTIPENLTPAAERLEKPTIDNLTNETIIRIPQFADHSKYVFRAAYADGVVMTTDGKNNLYFLGESSPQSFNIEKMTLSKGNELQTELLLFFSKKDFSFNYVDAQGLSRSFLYFEFIPSSLYYDRNSDKIFVMGSDVSQEMTVFYQVYPSVKMIAYDRSSDLKSKYDFIQPSDDGQTYYISNSFKGIIYTAHEGEALSTHTYINGIRTHHLASLMDKGHLYLLDQDNKTIQLVTPGVGASIVATLNVGDILSTISHEGNFYLMGGNQFYRVDVNGKLEEYAKLDKAVYHKGVYNFKTHNYDPTPTPYGDFPPSQPGMIEILDRYEPKRIVPGLAQQRFIIDPKGNIIIYDDLYRILRKINLFKE